MRGLAGTGGTVDPRKWWRVMWVAIAALLVLPLIAMQFTREMAWDRADFAMAGALLIGGGLMFEAAARLVRDPKALALVGVVLAGAVALIWADAAVGVF